MSSSGFDVPLIVERGPSRYLAISVVTVHAAAVCALIAAGPPGWVTLPGVIGALVSMRRIWRRHVSLTDRRAARRAVWTAGGWWLEEAGGRRVRARLVPGALVASSLVVIRLQPARGPAYGLVLAADALSPPVLRRLRARLRARGGPPGGGFEAGEGVQTGMRLSTLGRSIRRQLRPWRRDDAGSGQR